MGTQGTRSSFQAAAAVVGVLAVLCICADVRAQTCAPDFLITPTPNGPQSNRLRAAAAFDVNDVWAVGFTNGSFETPRVLHWDGQSWAATDLFGYQAQLNGIAAESSASVWSVGFELGIPSLPTGMAAVGPMRLSFSWVRGRALKVSP